MKEIINVIKYHEGFRADPYKCPSDKWTIGYGSTFDPYTGKVVTKYTDTITEKEAEEWLAYQVSADIKAVLGEFSKYEIINLGTNRISALVNMNYNLGHTGLMKFRRMWNALYEYDFETAAKEALDSKWANQVGTRAEHIAHCIKHGEWKL